MRSVHEIAFRTRQELTNLALLTRGPRYEGPEPEQIALPDPAELPNLLQNSTYGNDLIRLADSVLAGQLPVLGAELCVGENIQWRRDYAHGKESGLDYFRRLPYLDFAAVGDHKFIWEVNRHQHWVLLAQAYLFTGNARYLKEISHQLSGWLEQNPFQRGINWASALEVAFRAISWIWVYHLVGSQIEGAVKRKLVNGLFRHGLHLEANLSVYFSPNTHLLGEAVALFAIGRLFPQFPHSRAWAAKARQIVLGQLDFQVKEDGSHFEQSSYYHVYALDFLLWFYLLANRPSAMKPKLQKMAGYLHHHLGVNRRIVFFGDDDGGRLFHPYGDRREFGRATLATCAAVFGESEWRGTRHDLAQQAAWWLGPQVLGTESAEPPKTSQSRRFADAGMIFLRRGRWQLQFDSGPFGYGGAGHSHSDTLSFCLQKNGEDVLIDPGTFTYIRDLEIRNWYRGTAAHNTVLVKGRPQAMPAGPFRWASKPTVQLNSWGEAKEHSWIDASCRYDSVEHRRRLLLDDERVVILDQVTNGSEPIGFEQWWHFGEYLPRTPIASTAALDWIDSQYSVAYGSEQKGKSARVVAEQTNKDGIVTVFGLEGQVPSAESVLNSLASLTQEQPPSEVGFS